jgi:hypothetical protein
MQVPHLTQPDKFSSLSRDRGDLIRASLNTATNHGPHKPLPGNGIPGTAGRERARWGAYAWITTLPVCALLAR